MERRRKDGGEDNGAGKQRRKARDGRGRAGSLNLKGGVDVCEVTQGPPEVFLSVKTLKVNAPLGAEHTM